MEILDHWHPVLPSKRLKDEPLGIRLAGNDLVVFRCDAGRVGALEDCCPHRRMRLSLGRVVADRLQCPYHGWSFNRLGEGESPGTPRLRTCAAALEAIERHGAIWVKSRRGEAAFPHFDVAGYYHVDTLQHRVKAPLELVVDNFTEIEHTPTVHGVFGYALERMNEVEVQFVPSDAAVRVINVGPSKRLGLLLRLLLGVREGFRFHDDWTTHFSPVYSVYDHWWSDPSSGREARVRWRLFIFFTPRDEQETEIVTFAYTKSRYPGPAGGVRLFKWLVVRQLDQEIRSDVRILESLADKNPTFDGMRLSRFDRVLGLTRERIERIYRSGTRSEGRGAREEPPEPCPLPLVPRR